MDEERERIIKSHSPTGGQKLNFHNFLQEIKLTFGSTVITDQLQGDETEKSRPSSHLPTGTRLDQGS